MDLENQNQPNEQESVQPQQQVFTQPQAQQNYQQMNGGGQNGSGFSIAALVCGILGIIGGLIPVVCYFTFILAVLGIIFGAMGMKRQTPGKRGLAIAGLVCGIVGASFGLIGMICITACIASASSFASML